MEIRFGRLPDNHYFIIITRPLVEWSFKLLSWLLIAATLLLAAEKSGSYVLYGAASLASVLPFAFIYAFLHWLWSIEPYERKQGTTARLSWWGKVRKLAVVTMALALWWTLVFATHLALNQTLLAIVEVQRTAGAPN